MALTRSAGINAARLRSRLGFGARRTVLLFLIFGVGVGSVQAQERLSVYVDAGGRIVFTNDPLPVQEPPTPADLSDPASSENKARIDGLIDRAAGEHRMDPELIRAVVQVESNYNPFAISPRGARGLMQLIPATAQRFGVEKIFDPEENLDGGIRYLKYLMEMFDGDLQLSLAAYNAGENAVARRRSVPPIPETRNYLRKINRIYPLRRPAQASNGASPAPKVVTFVDGNGIVHFTNTGEP